MTIGASSLKAAGPINTQRVESAQLSYSTIIHARFAALCVDFMPSGRPQGKLVRVLAGNRIRRCRGYPARVAHLAQWFAFELSAEIFRQVYVPPGYAHGIFIISQVADLEYQSTDFYNPEDEIRIIWNDSSIGIAWPVREPLLYRKDSYGYGASGSVGSAPLVARNGIVKILIAGASGQHGPCLQIALNRHEVVALDRRALDISQLSLVREAYGAFPSRAVALPPDGSWSANFFAFPASKPRLFPFQIGNFQRWRSARTTAFSRPSRIPESNYLHGRKGLLNSPSTPRPEVD
jgi:hypothetical protein